MHGRIAESLVDQWADPRWRLNNLYYITDKKGERVLFEMNWAQLDLFNDMHYNNIILKARQLGFSTFIQLFMLDACVFNDNVRSGTIADTREKAEEIFLDKVKYPYDNLPDAIKEANPAVNDSARQLKFGNNSLLRVGTSLRGGTYQYVHISEHGKICADSPDKAREIRTGTLNAIATGQMCFIESTAMGQDGDFYSMCQEAESLKNKKTDLTDLDFKFFFFPWWKEPSYSLAGVYQATQEMDEYFGELAATGIDLTEAQKQWYSRKAVVQRDDMNREYPSTPDEAFKASIEGAYYGKLIADAERAGRVSGVPHDTATNVETWWDLGLNDEMAIWFIQRSGKELHAIDYYHNSGEGLAHYTKMLHDRKEAYGYQYGDMLWPHDGNTRIMDENARRRSEVMQGLGYDPQIVPRSKNIMDDIEVVRNMIPRIWFDERRTVDGVKALRNYKKEWDDNRATFRKTPLHNWASNGADALRTGCNHHPVLHSGKPKPGTPRKLVYPANHPSRRML